MKHVKPGFARFACASLLLIPLALSSTAANAVTEGVRVRGAVVKLEGSMLIVHPSEGANISVVLAEGFHAIQVVKASMADIKEGAYIGTATASDSDTTLRSLEVVVFPPSMKGAGEGHYPWDLKGASMMTNATVSSSVKGVEGQTVTVTYKGGEKKINVPADVPVVSLVPATPADIVPGEVVFVPSQREADGTVHAGLVIFGKDGVSPPM